MARFRVSKLTIDYYSKIKYPLTHFQYRLSSSSINSCLRFHSLSPRNSITPCIAQSRSAKCQIPQHLQSINRVSNLVSTVSQQPRKVLRIQSIQIIASHSTPCSTLSNSARHFVSQAIEPKPSPSLNKECSPANAQVQIKEQSPPAPNIKVIATIVPKGFSSVSDPPQVSTPQTTTVSSGAVTSSVDDTHDAVMDESRAMREFMLTEADLERIPHRQSRNPYLGSGYDSYGEKPMIFVYRRGDVQRAAYEKYGGQRGFERFKSTIEDDEAIMRNSMIYRSRSFVAFSVFMRSFLFSTLYSLHSTDSLVSVPLFCLLQTAFAI